MKTFRPNSNRYPSLGVASLLGLSLWSGSVSASGGDDCRVGEKSVEFTLFVDQECIGENSWTLSCEGEGAIWDVAVADRPDATYDDLHMVRDQTCLPEDYTCTFTLVDILGDGISAPGNYTLTWGATTIAIGDNGAFEERSYCFGPNCPIPPLEEAPCVDINVALTTDSAPQETEFLLECDMETLLEGYAFEAPFENIDATFCVDPNSCCTFEITDQGNNGLTGYELNADGIQYGSLSVELDSEQVLEYHGEHGYQFSTLSVNFGKGC